MQSIRTPRGYHDDSLVAIVKVERPRLVTSSLHLDSGHQKLLAMFVKRE